jgi:hypothetical protein
MALQPQPLDHGQLPGSRNVRNRACYVAIASMISK